MKTKKKPGAQRDSEGFMPEAPGRTKRGPPFKEPKERRTKHLMIRMRVDELKELDSYCAFIGSKTPSTVIRELAFRAIRRKGNKK